jgi:hypothetical protein
MLILYMRKINSINIIIIMYMKDMNNDVDTNNGEPKYYVQQLKCKIFKRIPGKIKKNSQFINLFT